MRSLSWKSGGCARRLRWMCEVELEEWWMCEEVELRSELLMCSVSDDEMTYMNIHVNTKVK